MRTFVVLLLFAAVLCAQTRKQPRQQNHVSELETPIATFQGKLQSVTKKDVVLEIGEDKTISFHISHKTRFMKNGKPIKPTAIPAGAALTVEGKRDLLGNVDAVTVTVDTVK